MQYSNSEETEGKRHHSYTGYAGELQEYERRLSGQELEGEHDEKLADRLSRLIEHEVQPERAFWQHPRLLLGLVSLCALVCLFGLLVLALLIGADGNVGGFVFAFLISCVSIIAVNGYFNWSSVATLRHLTHSFPGSPHPEFDISAVSSMPLPVPDKLTTIYYRGRLAMGASSITMHWGYSNWRDGFMMHWGRGYWNGVTDIPMIKQSNGMWAATITVPSAATALNMAFYNQSRVWDNNNNSNYHLNVQSTSDK